MNAINSSFKTASNKRDIIKGSRCGEIGIHVRFRCVCRKALGVRVSPSAHNILHRRSLLKSNPINIDLIERYNPGEI